MTADPLSIRRLLGRVLLVGFLLLLVSPPAPSQDRPKKFYLDEETDIRVGFQADAQASERPVDGRSQPIFKPGSWAPVFILLRAGPDGIGDGEVTVESPDSDDVLNCYSVRLGSFQPGETRTILAYTKSGGLSGASSADITIRVRADRVRESFKKSFPGIEPGQMFYLTVGGRCPGLANSVKTPEGQQATFKINEYVGVINRVEDMPRHWFGYAAVDLLILTTGNREGFLMPLLNDRENRKEALVEWVRRGGRIIVCAGINQDLVAQIPEFQPLLPAKITGTLELNKVILAWNKTDVNIATTEVTNPPPRDNPQGASPPVLLGKLELMPDRPARPLLKQGEHLLGVQGTYGLGRVTLLAFDPDRAPFQSFKNDKDFWEGLTRSTTLKYFDVLQPGPQQPQQWNQGYPYDNYNRPDLVADMQNHLESFEDVPVISFGWVALFILLYIVIVGPLDYFLLKKVFKRLELTWLTFPVVVLTISAGAYFLAYWIKGKDLKVNKIDVVDIDLQSRQVYGNTYFTLFSPRIQHYNIGIEPASDSGWMPPSPGRYQSSIVMTWLGRVESDPWGRGGTGGHSLFSRSYDYENHATENQTDELYGVPTALRRVPVQVWSTKTFTASWQAPVIAAKPQIEANLFHPANADNEETRGLVAGTITSNLPVDLEEVVLFYRNRYHELKNGLQSGSTRPLPEGVGLKQKGQDLQQWFTLSPAPTTGYAYGYGGNQNYPPTTSADWFIKPMLFFDYPHHKVRHRNSAFRTLDQHWRVQTLASEEVILYGKVARKEGDAEQITLGNESPSRLWLGEIPDATKSRPPLVGKVRQETYVRVFMPVRPRAK